jgi:uncharacterized protein (TIGR00369 family)
VTADDFAEALNQSPAGWLQAMGVRFVRATEQEVICEWDVERVHHQAYGIVHGGVHAGIIETLCSVGAALSVLPAGRSVVGLENHTSFVRAVRQGRLRGAAKPITRGRRSQLWEATVTDESDRTVATGRVRLLVLAPDSELAGEEVSRPPAISEG